LLAELKMKNIGKALALFLMFAVMATFTTAITYAMVYGVIWYLGFSFGLPARYAWAPLVGTCVVFLIGLATALRNQIPDITRLKWDSGTTDDCPSRVSIPGEGGRLWNMNPLGPQSVASVGAIGGAILCAGPSLAISAFIVARGELKKDSQQASGGYSHAARNPQK
jgi:hypothetical protein